MTKLIEMKCDCGPRYKWAQAETLFIPELGLLHLSKPIDYRFIVTFVTTVNDQPASVEISTNLVRVYYK